MTIMCAVYSDTEACFATVFLFCKCRWYHVRGQSICCDLYEYSGVRVVYVEIHLDCEEGLSFNLHCTCCVIGWRLRAQLNTSFVLVLVVLGSLYSIGISVTRFFFVDGEYTISMGTSVVNTLQCVFYRVRQLCMKKALPTILSPKLVHWYFLFFPGYV